MYREILNYKDVLVDVISQIDNATFIVSDIIKTPFGETRLYDVSTGCKAVIIAMLYPDFCVSYMEVGHNVFDYTVNLSNHRDMYIFTPIVLFAKDMNSRIYMDNTKVTVKDYMLKMTRLCHRK